MVDGASVFVAMRKIVAPLMIPGICTVAIFTFSGSWGNFFCSVHSAPVTGEVPRCAQAVPVFRAVRHGRLRQAGRLLCALCDSVCHHVHSFPAVYVQGFWATGRNERLIRAA